MVKDHLKPQTIVLDGREQADWSDLCRQADQAVRASSRRHPRVTQSRQRSRKVSLLLWAAEQLAGSIAAVTVFLLVWTSLEGTIESTQVRTALAGAPGLAIWVIMVLLIRWAPQNKLAFLLDRR